MIARPDPGVLIALFAYAAYSASDALIRGGASDLPVYTTAFFIALFALLPMSLARPPGERWRDFWRMRHPYIVHGRIVSGFLAGWASVYAFTHLPLAQAYALIFLMPFFVTVISIVVLGETIGWRRWTALGVGFLGVLIVIRPGFQTIEPAHLAALVVAFLGGLTITLLRKVALTERRVSLLLPVYLYSLLINGTVMVANDAMPSPDRIATLAAIGVLAGMGNVMIVLATARTPASQLGPTQYSQILWGILLGMVFFQEFPDALTYLGLAIVAGAGLFTYLRELARGVLPRRFVFFRNRP